MYKTNTKNEAKRLRATPFAIAKLEEQLLNGEKKLKVQYCESNIGNKIDERCTKNYFAFWGH